MPGKHHIEAPTSEDCTAYGAATVGPAVAAPLPRQLKLYLNVDDARQVLSPRQLTLDGDDARQALRLEQCDIVLAKTRGLDEILEREIARLNKMLQENRAAIRQVSELRATVNSVLLDRIYAIAEQGAR